MKSDPLDTGWGPHVEYTAAENRIITFLVSSLKGKIDQEADISTLQCVCVWREGGACVCVHERGRAHTCPQSCAPGVAVSPADSTALPQLGGSQPVTAKARDLQTNPPSSADSCGDPGLQARRALGLLAHVHVCTQESGCEKGSTPSPASFLHS